MGGCSREAPWGNKDVDNEVSDAGCPREAERLAVVAGTEFMVSAGIPASTIHALLGELDRAAGFAPDTVLVLDEAGMAPTRLTAALFARAERAGVKCVDTSWLADDRPTDGDALALTAG